jgi:hypothetical protein
VNNGKVAANLFIYVDDGWVTAPSKDENWHATRQATSRFNKVGIQEAKGGGIPGNQEHGLD